MVCVGMVERVTFEGILRASSYEPGNRAGPVTGTNFVVCSYGKFQPGYRDEKESKRARNVD